MKTGPGGQRGILRVALLYVLLLVSASVVVWRQSRALEVLSRLDALRRERAVAQAERAERVRTLEALESRAHVVRAARDLGMHVPTSEEIVILPLRADPTEAAASAGRDGDAAPARSRREAE